MKLFKIFCEASCYYVLIRIALFSLSFINKLWIDQLNYHHENEWLWYLLWWILPLTISILLSFKLRFKFFTQTGFILMPLLIFGTIILGINNNNYWGYYFKRPSIFKAVKNIDKINSISHVSTTSIDERFDISQTRQGIRDLNDRSDPYYQNRDRAFMTILDHKPVELQKWIRTGIDSTKIYYEDLSLITEKIKHSNIIVPAKDGYEEYDGNNLSGLVIDFYSKNKNRYCYVSLSGGQVKNDHYPYYEFLFQRSNNPTLINKQMYFVDLAGMEGSEYCNLAPPLEFFLFFVSGILILVFGGFDWIKKQRIISKIKKPINENILDDDL